MPPREFRWKTKMNNISDFTVGFWTGWVILLTVIGITFIIGLLWTSARGTHIRSEEAVWDGTLREGNAPPPKWWFMLFLVLIICSCGYLVLYPGLGSYPGALGWTQHGQYKQAQEYYDSRFQEQHLQWRTASFDELAANDSYMQTAAAVFADNCAGCHGRDGSGQAQMFPDLTDFVWQWGGEDAQVYASVAHGRRAAMPPQTALTKNEQDAMADYVRARAGLSPQTESHDAAAAQFATLCAVCHNEDGGGNPALGAPSLTDDAWLYGGDKSVIMETLAHGRSGEMPAQLSRLGEARTRLLAAWIASGKIRDFPPR